ncbi:EscN/YscN/HrcN family type III secretion system ATPase [Bordetella genomosp. 8]|uniref:Type 3 secretion system ATPase n=1 Tax=Bordetella genomosp. 8 TaxID=1416806 RepID=A0A1W6YQ66_9BORD|nr:type III secretion system ATPase SctN [Bordetella genomosp. 8]ARP83240.1 EscN/YscN/HrcN family type III secretion system ATPase [Bordetella genomosp. 8]
MMFDHILPRLRAGLAEARTMEVIGRVTQVTGTIIRAAVAGARVGQLCILRDPEGGGDIKAEVIGFAEDAALLTPIGDMRGISSRTEVLPTDGVLCVPVGTALLGRVLDGLGRPLDEATRGALVTTQTYPVLGPAPHPLSRTPIEQPLELGIRVIDGLLTCGVGQRMGIFAAAGGGKSTLMGMLANDADVDVRVVALIGERGREVGEFLQRDLGDKLGNSVVVCATSDRSAMERVKSAYVATAIAEYFRDQGKRVLLLMDSVTRFARAQREIGLAAGEPPTRRGFPPSVFAVLPRLLERAGMNERGSITAFYTVLVEGDDMTEPVADEVRSILDGHIVLSRKLGAENHFPAVDVLASASRVMGNVVSREHATAAGRFRELMAKYAEIELLLNIGEYQPGHDPVADEAVRKIGDMRQFLRQASDEKDGFDATVARMAGLVHG